MRLVEVQVHCIHLGGVGFFYDLHCAGNLHHNIGQKLRIILIFHDNIGKTFVAGDVHGFDPVQDISADLSPLVFIDSAIPGFLQVVHKIKNDIFHYILDFNHTDTPNVLTIYFKAETANVK